MQTEVECNLRKLLKKRERERERWADRERGVENKLSLSRNMLDSAIFSQYFP